MKKVLRRTLTVLLVFLFTISIGACTNHEVTSGSTAKMSKIYKSIKELKDNAVEIVEVEVLENVKSIEYGKVPFTISKVKVISSLKGEQKSGDEIEILETGGIIGGNPIYFDGVPVLQPGTNMVLFLYKYEGPVAENVYYPLGEYMGKFIIKDDKVEQQAVDEYKLKDYKVVNLEEFKEKVKEAK